MKSSYEELERKCANLERRLERACEAHIGIAEDNVMYTKMWVDIRLLVGREFIYPKFLYPWTVKKIRKVLDRNR